ncbi:MAG: glycosyltransferase family 1 protein [Magnetococcales bacterium]|nr:glycosyltransferase family 1 protein [Magnetococcales bacterium]
MKIAVLFASDTVPNRCFMDAVLHGFQALGVEARGWLSQLRGEALLRLCDDFQPDLLFEMNRSRSEIPELPSQILHLCWIVDTDGRKLTRFRDSEILYFFQHHWMRDHDGRGSRLRAWLPPGYDPGRYFPEERPYAVDLSFVGHLSHPWTEAELNRVIPPVDAGRPPVLFKDVANQVVASLDATNQDSWTLDDYIEHALRTVAEAGGDPSILDLAVQYDLSNRIYARMVRRQRMLDAAVALTPGRSLRLYGTSGLGAHAAYAPFYGGFLTTPTSMAEVYRSSRVNLHEGVGLHFRSLDAMACGGVIFFMDSPYDRGPGAMEVIFRENEHFVMFDPANLGEKVAWLLEHPRRMREIGQAAATAVLQGHTWRHRAEQILADVARIKQSPPRNP